MTRPARVNVAVERNAEEREVSDEVRKEQIDVEGNTPR
jgi:hypothetical protein